jgi:hypothetical protein
MMPPRRPPRPSSARPPSVAGDFGGGKDGALFADLTDIPTLPDEDVEDVDPTEGGVERFFAGVSDAPLMGMVDLPPVDTRADRLDSRVSGQRRRHVLRYIASAVAVSCVIGIAAGVRISAKRSAAAAESVQHSSKTAASIASPPAPSIAPAAETADPAQAALEAAVEAKNESQRALEQRHVAASIEAGERSVALDPTDGEAWLILGAAYMQRGANGEARRCFKSCVELGTHGPQRECAAFAR